MSGATSYLGFVERTDMDIIRDAQPVSAYRGWVTRNNMQALIEQSPQHLINWMGGPAPQADTFLMYPSVHAELGDAGTSVTWCQEFVHTWLSSSRVANFDLRVFAIAQEEIPIVMDVEPRIVAASFAVGDAAAPAIFFTPGATTNQPNGEEAITEQVFVTTVPTVELSPFGILEDGAVNEAQVAIMRLEIKLTLESGTSFPWGLLGVLLREFA